MELTILGCGASMGVPAIGCGCGVCTSDDPRNQRTRTSMLLRTAETTVLIDAGPDFRQQALRQHIQWLDAVLLTHAHTDHIGGIDDLRPINFAMGRAIPMYGSAATLRQVQQQFAYVFASGESMSTRPQIDLRLLSDEPFTIGDLTITPLPIYHGDWAIHGFRFGNAAYITDVSLIPDETVRQLDDLDVLVLGALRHKPHPLHWTVEQAVAQIEQISPRRAFLTHMAHDLEYTTTNATLPPNIRLAYDGLTLNVEE